MHKYINGIEEFIEVEIISLLVLIPVMAVPKLLDCHIPQCCS